MSKNDNNMKSNEIDLNNVVYSDVKANASGGRTIYINYKNKNGDVGPFRWASPEMDVPFGLASWEGGKFNTDIAFSKNKSDGQQTFHKMMENFQEKIIKDAVKYSTDWFKKKYTKLDVVKVLFTDVIRKSKDRDTGELNGKFPDSIRIKLYKGYKEQSDTFQCEAFDSNRHKISVEDALQRGATVKCLFQVSSVWVAAQRFGVTLVLKQVLVVSSGSEGDLKKGVCAFDESDEENESNDSEESDEESDE